MGRGSNVGFHWPRAVQYFLILHGSLISDWMLAHEYWEPIRSQSAVQYKKILHSSLLSALWLVLPNLHLWLWHLVVEFFFHFIFQDDKKITFCQQIVLYCNFSVSFKDEISFWVHFGGKSNLENFQFESFFWFVIQLWFFVFHLWSKYDLKLFGKWKLFFMFSKLFYL